MTRQEQVRQFARSMASVGQVNAVAEFTIRFPSLNSDDLSELLMAAKIFIFTGKINET